MTRRDVLPTVGADRSPGARRHRTLLASAVVLAALTACSSEEGTDVPAPPAAGAVLDVSEVLTADEERAVSELVDAENARTDAARVAVLLVPSADGDLEDYAREVATRWGVGDEGADNGVLVVAATDDRELRVEVADGVRDRFDDDEAATVVEDVLAPAFGDERYAEGLTAAVVAVYTYAEGGTPPAPASEPTNWAVLGAWIGGAGLLVGGLVAWLVGDRRRRHRLADGEIAAAREQDPGFDLTDEQRAAYRRYRYHRRGSDAVSNPGAWLPLYVANPALWSGGSQGSSSGGGSSFGGGGGFSGGGASGGY
ncbi:TPM domain-containing protein [Cellulomonas marina]|uniref:TPM domain-containing protein n=1 Tax=Cellulomonas marina TaxID=988821 RepID=A0A1I1AQM8_9CELL|nr:TPM domain-containing protein [Cellulomonas marina]GIG30808.1 hypothetical protein Cma02nite_34080 [Cellulomonas marina]SFB38643.1 uncharacterized protein SAMN05421867_11959 [Cellulomonas marina]